MARAGSGRHSKFLGCEGLVPFRGQEEMYEECTDTGIPNAALVAAGCLVNYYRLRSWKVGRHNDGRMVGPLEDRVATYLGLGPPSVSSGGVPPGC